VVYIPYPLPFGGTSQPYKQFMKGPIIDQLLSRDQKDFAELMLHHAS